VLSRTNDVGWRLLFSLEDIDAFKDARVVWEASENTSIGTMGDTIFNNTAGKEGELSNDGVAPQT